MDTYLGEAGRYRRPIVTNVYNEPIDLFDRHLYEKGGIVLHMLRVLLGETLFWKAIRRYAISRRGTQRRDDGPAARDRGGDRPQPRLVLRPVGLRRRPPGAQGQLRLGRRGEDGEARAEADADGRATSRRSFRLPLRLDFKLEDGDGRRAESR